jgi:hypothetical protein
VQQEHGSVEQGRPLTGQAFQPPGTGEPGWLRLIIWLAAVVLWAVASIRVLRPARGNHA